MQDSTNLVAKFIIKTEAIQQVEISNLMSQRPSKCKFLELLLCMLTDNFKSQTNAITNVSALIKSPIGCYSEYIYF
jgi:hypothetical protein